MSSIADAVVAAVQAAVPGRQVWDAMVSGTTIPDKGGYAIVYCPDGDAQLGNLAGDVDGKSVVVRVQSFGPTRQAAGWLSRHITDYLITSGVTVAGWGSAWVSEHFNHMPSPDESVKEYAVVMVYDELHMLFAKDS